ncbi:MAG: glycosyltransferase [Desulfarculus sp.]|nr:glycosyltransferase [Desulfarculus sp.]
MTTTLHLSLVIPLYNEAQRFDRLRRGLDEFGPRAGGLAYEVILVNDGSQDDTPALMERLREQWRAVRGQGGGGPLEVRLINQPRNQGKGQALRAGVMAARGAWVLTLDADMACPPSQLLEWQERGYVNLREAPDPLRAFYGCREHPTSQVNDETYRRLMGKVFNTLVQTVTGLPLDDTQCGFKLYPLETAQRCFELVINWGWAHDVEISKVLGELGCVVQALPITWTAIAGSKIKPLSDAFRMLMEVLRIETSFILRFRLGLARPGLAQAQDLLHQRLSLLLGLALLVLVFCTFQDHGLTAGESTQAAYGRQVVNYYASGFGDKSALSAPAPYLHGGLFEAVAAVLGKGLPWGPYQSRHLLTALAGLLGIAGAWRLAGYMAGPRAAFWAVALLAATPLYYGNIFNNSQDIPFAAAFVWSVYYLALSLGNLPRVPRGLTLKLGLALGAGLGVKVGGVILVVWMALLMALWAVGQLPARPARAITRDLAALLARWCLPAGAIAYAVMLLGWPWAQGSPLYHPYLALRAWVWPGQGQLQLFDGLYYCSLSLPPSYIPKYLLYTLPEVFIVALAALAILGAGRPRPAGGQGRKQAVSLGWICLLGAMALPSALAAVSGSDVAGGPGGLIFLAPPLAVLGGAGVDRLAGLLGGWRRGAGRVLAGCLALALLYQASLMARLYPYEYVFFNSLIGGLKGAQGKYELDYRGAAYGEALVKLGDIVRQEKASGPASGQRVYHVFFRGGDREVMSYLGTALPPTLQRASDPLRADFHVDFTRWDYHQATNGVTLATVERLGVPLNYIKDLRPVASKTYQARKRLCERDFQPSAQVPLEN